jgi:hypothetical protein
MLLADYGTTAAAVASVVLLWWGGALVSINLLARATR